MKMSGWAFCSGWGCGALGLSQELGGNLPRHNGQNIHLGTIFEIGFIAKVEQALPVAGMVKEGQ